jgi:hypothetical protein
VGWVGRGYVGAGVPFVPIPNLAQVFIVFEHSGG